MERTSHVLAVIGGSGLYEIDGLTNVVPLRVDTPYGAPSDVIIQGDLSTPNGTTRMLFLPRHGRGHRIPPHAINYRANICALKMSGATHLISVSAVGSMLEKIFPGDLVIVDQFIDLTKRRISTFFDEGIAAHVTFADPVCAKTASALLNAAESAAAQERVPPATRRTHVHHGGTYVCMEGPQFSTRAESHVYRSWGVSVIGMTAMPEAKLAREAELPFASLALATDYDCWHETEEDVSVPAVVAILQRNIALARRCIANVATSLPDPTTTKAHGALKHAIMTNPEQISEAASAKLAWLVSGKNSR